MSDPSTCRPPQPDGADHAGRTGDERRAPTAATRPGPRPPAARPRPAGAGTRSSRPTPGDRPEHPSGQAAILLVVVTLVIVGLAALSATGRI